MFRPTTPRIERLVLQARLILAFERLWPCCVALLGITAVFVTVSWLGLWLVVPPLGRAVGCLAFLLTAVIATGWLARRGVPSRRDALARLDRDLGEPHRLISANEDQLSNAEADPTTRALWDLHRKRIAAAIDKVRLSAPSPKVAARDPFAVRAGVLLCLVAAGFLAGPERAGRLAAAFAWSTSGPVMSARIDAWIDPPAYTGKPPIVLLGPDLPGNGKQPMRVEAPTGSAIVIRAAGDVNLDITHDGGLKPIVTKSASPAGAAPAASAAAAASAAPAATGSRLQLAGDGHLTVARNGAIVQRFDLKAIPDLPPRITLIGDPEPNYRGSLTLAYKIEDDYGVTGAEAHFANPLVRGQAVTGRTLVEPPHAALTLPAMPGGLGDGKTTLDLAESPWAGATVTMTLSALDEGGNTGESKPVTLTLPSRPFTKPLARALVEQRRNLVLKPDDHGAVLDVLDALMIAPDAFGTTPAIYLGLHTAQVRLAHAKSDADLLDVADFLWQMAVRIEDGDLSKTEQDLRAAQKALKDALDRGAPPDELKRLTETLRQQMDKYLSEMTRDGQNQQAQNQDARRDRNTRTITPDQLKSMMDRMEQAARNGDTAEAQRMLDQLNNILENLKTAKRGSAAQSQATRDMNRAMNDLDRMMRDQGDVRDKTFRQGQQGAEPGDQPSDDGVGQGDDKDEDAQAGDQPNGSQAGQTPGQQGEGSGGDQGLQGRQGALRQQLQALQKRFKGLGMKGEQGLADAEQAMKEAEGALGRGRSGTKQAVEAQGRALEGLQRGANGMEQQMAQGGQQGSEPDGEDGGQEGEAQRQGQDLDPLGRPRQGRGAAQGRDMDVGGGLAERAQQVMQELRRRLGDPSRGQVEQDYLERLLKRY